MRKNFGILFVIAALLSSVFTACVSAKTVSAPGDSIIQLVTIPKADIDNTNNKGCEIRFFLRQPASISVELIDAYDNHVRTLVQKRKCNKGTMSLSWDGKDDDKNYVPVGAYIPIINAVCADGKRYIYDPRETTGWKPVATSKPIYDKKTGYVDFRTEKPAYVRIRIGHQKGPMYLTLVDWETKLSGKHHIPWDGMDASGKINLSSKPLNFIIQAMSFPENTLYVTKSPTTQIKRKKSTTFKLKPVFESVKKSDYQQQVSLNSYLYRKSKGPSPRFKVELPEAKNSEEGISVISRECPLKIVIDERDVGWLANEHFEMLMFIDDVYYTEEEEGYSPIVWPWDTTELEDGVHLVTIMIQSFKDRIGSHSLQVRVQNEPNSEMESKLNCSVNEK